MMLRYLTALLVLVWGSLGLRAAEALPDRPANYFNDYAHVASAATASRLNSQLTDFERATGNQFLVVVYPKLQSDSSIEDFTQRTAQHWGVGQKEHNNGVVLFVFTQDRKMYIQVGYGLEGALPDGLCKQIIENELKPRFREGDFNGGLSAGVQSIIAATKFEYKGTGRTVAEGNQGRGNNPIVLLVIIVMVVLILFLKAVGGGSRNGFLIGSGGLAGGSFGGGGSSSGGGFSGGGGSFGGGGSGGSW